MKGFIRLAFTGVIVMSLAALAPTPPPASALTICVATTTISLSSGFGLPVLTSNTASFSAPSGGVCAPTISSPGGTGTMTGACGLATGSGTTNVGWHFTFTITGTTIVFTGEIYGTGLLVPDPTSPGSCTNKSATRFLLTSFYVAVP